MSKLELGLCTLATLALVVGCDERPDADAGPRDTGVNLMDGGMVDSGPRIDTGLPPGTDAGPPSSCGPTGPCSISDQSSCPTGEACLMFGNSADGWMTQCVAEGVIADGQPCMPGGAPNQCQRGSQCFGEEGATVCTRLCCDSGGGAAGCAPGATCQLIQGAEGGGTCIAGDGCDIQDPNSCGGGTMGCFHLGDEGETTCNTIGANPSQPGAACTGGLNTCVPGYVCVGTDTTTCLKYCVPGGDPCPDTFQCAGLNGITGIGVCAPETTT